jgi:hypothetical protein
MFSLGRQAVGEADEEVGEGVGGGGGEAPADLLEIVSVCTL